MFLFFIQIGNELVWSNPVPNSTLYARPVLLMNDKENRKVITEHFKPVMDALQDVWKKPIECEHDGTPIEVWVGFFQLYSFVKTATVCLFDNVSDKQIILFIQTLFKF